MPTPAEVAIEVTTWGFHPHIEDVETECMVTTGYDIESEEHYTFVRDVLSILISHFDITPHGEYVFFIG